MKNKRTGGVSQAAILRLIPLKFKMNRKSIAIGKDKVWSLFSKRLFPSMFGMVSLVLVTAIDGIFIGHTVGSAGIAAVNLCQPLLMLFMGLGLMFGVGCSLVAEKFFSENKEYDARIHVTQAVLCATVLTLIIMALVLAFPHGTAQLLGSSEAVEPLVVDYLRGFMPAVLIQVWCIIGLYVMRLDGWSGLAVWCSVVAAVVSVALDWAFINQLDMGMQGAAIATSISVAISGLMVVAVVYPKRRTNRVKMCHLSDVLKNFGANMQNLYHQCVIGLMAFFGQFRIAVLIFVGNQLFMHYLGDTGVGAFGIACFYCPFVFMLGRAIALSAQPSITRHMNTSPARVLRVQKYALFTAFVSGALATMLFRLCPEALASVFVGSGDPAWALSVEGMPSLSLGFLFFVLNFAAIGYYQSVNRLKQAMTYELLRGIVLLIPAFILLPKLLDAAGIWLAMPVAEFLTFAVITFHSAMWIERDSMRKRVKEDKQRTV